MKKTIKIIAIILGLIVFLIGTPIAIGSYNKFISEAEYNNGICSACGEGYYKFEGGSHVKNDCDRYYYSCDKCDHTITTYFLCK